MTRNHAGEDLTAGIARQTGETSTCCNADVWIVPWYTLRLHGPRWYMNVRLCEECGEDR